VIYLRSDKPRAYSFLATADHVMKFSPPTNKQGLKGVANRLLGNFNDINMPKIVGIAHIQRTSNVVTVETDATHPFFVNDGPRIQNYAPDASFNGAFIIASVPDGTHFTFPQTGADTALLGAGGEVGLDEGRFTIRQRIIDHDQHQQAVGQRGAGLSLVQRPRSGSFAMGNSTWDQVTRILNFTKVRTLGLDQSPYKAPWEVTIQIFYEAVDAGNNLACMQQGGDVLRIDATISEEFQGDYEIMERKVLRQAGSAMLLELRMLEYIDTAFDDTQITAQVMSVIRPPRGIPAISEIDGSGNNQVNLASSAVKNRLPVGKHSYSSPNNLTNNAKVDSIDAGSNDTIRIYKDGGTPGVTAWDRYEADAVAESPAAGSINGIGYGVTRYVAWDGATYQAKANYPDVLHDTYRWAGKVVTVNAGGGGGTPGGGLTGGGGGGINQP